jgi:hypothetical protein
MRGGVILGALSLLSGVTAASIALLWLLLTWNTGLLAPLPEDLGDIEALMAFRRLSVAFMLVLPVSATFAILSGAAGCRQPSGKLGVACALTALTIFAIALPGNLGMV